MVNVDFVSFLSQVSGVKLVITEKVSFNTDFRELHTDFRRLARQQDLRLSALDLCESAFKKGFSALVKLIHD